MPCKKKWKDEVPLPYTTIVAARVWNGRSPGWCPILEQGCLWKKEILPVVTHQRKPALSGSGGIGASPHLGCGVSCRFESCLPDNFCKYLCFWHSFCILIKEHCGVEQWSARLSHKQEIVSNGSNPTLRNNSTGTWYHSGKNSETAPKSTNLTGWLSGE